LGGKKTLEANQKLDFFSRGQGAMETKKSTLEKTLMVGKNDYSKIEPQKKRTGTRQMKGWGSFHRNWTSTSQVVGVC